MSKKQTDLTELERLFLQNAIILFNQNFAKSLKECEHCDDYSRVSPYHAEGDIYTHTMMVLKEGLRILQHYKTIFDAEYFKLVFECTVLGCLLHDVGKHLAKTKRTEVSKSTGVEIEKTYFTGHEKVSGDLSIKFLKNFNLTQSQVNAILFSVIYHTAAHDTKNHHALFNNPDVLQRDVLNFVNEADRAGRITI